MAQPPNIARLGIFVGGKSSRMGGQPKGLLLTKDDNEPLVVRCARLAHELGTKPTLVGSAEPYAALLPRLEVLEDQPKDVGPLGGLAALLEEAQGGHVIAVACDMPQLTITLLKRVASEAPEAAVLAARNEQGLWEPLCARYDAARVLPILQRTLTEGVRSFQALFARLDVAQLTLDTSERAALIDWDTPADVARG